MCRQCAGSKACWSAVGARLSGGATAHVYISIYLLLLALAAHAMFSLPFPVLHGSPLTGKPLRDGFITIHNGWMVVLAAKTKCQNSNVQLLISFNLPSAAVLQHQVALEGKSHVGVSFQTTRRFNAGWITAAWACGCGGWSSTRSRLTFLFHPPQHMATVPSQSLINSCHSSHDQYHLISRVCVTLFPHKGSICNPRDRNASGWVEMKATIYRSEKGQPYISFRAECHFHNVFAVDAFHLGKNQ